MYGFASEHLQTVLDSPRLMHSHEPACKSNSHKARTDFAARNTSGSCSARFWFTLLRIYTIVFGHALTVESSLVEFGRTCTGNIACSFHPSSTYRWNTCAGERAHSRSSCAKDSAACARALACAFVRIRIRTTCSVCRWIAVWLRWLPDRPPLLSVTPIAVRTEQTCPRILHARSLWSVHGRFLYLRLS